jgi:hypothetical protein
MICRTCVNFATKTTEGAGHFLLYGCRKRKVTFGTEADWKAGKWLGTDTDKVKLKIADMPKTCKDYAGNA